MIRIENLSVIYPNGVIALKPASLSFSQGQFTVLLGSSGAGKSTLLRTLNLLVRPTGGEVISEEIGVLRTQGDLRKHRRSTAMIFQQHQLIKRYSALKNVLTSRIGYYSVMRSLFPPKKDDILLALHCLERVGLLDQAQTRVDALSGGQQQRVGIARALCQGPRLILADEPVASLDPATAHHVLTLLRDICKEDGITAVMSLHQVDLALTFGDRIVGLSGGHITFDLTPSMITEQDLEELYNHPVSTGSAGAQEEALNLQSCGSAV
jgi:phosphonate transport system ATP-binding protein